MDKNIHSKEEITELETIAKSLIEKILIGEKISNEDLPTNKKYLQTRGIIITLRNNEGRILIRVGELMPDKSLIQNLVELSVFIGEKLKTEKKTTTEIRRLRIEIIIPGILEKTTVKEINTQKNGLKCRYYMKEGIILPDEVNPQTGIPTTDKIKYLEKLCQKTGIPPDAWEKDKFELWKFNI